MPLPALALIGALAPTLPGSAPPPLAPTAAQDPRFAPSTRTLDARDLRERLGRVQPDLVIDGAALERATARDGDVEVRVPLAELPVRDFEYGDLTAAGWADASDRAKAEGDEAVLKLAPGVTTVLRPKAVESLRLGADPTFCAGTLLHPTGETAPDGTAVVRQWSLFVCSRNDPVTWHADAEAYATSLVVGVEDAERSGRSQPLPQPITVQFFLEGRGLEVEPTALRIERSGTDGYVEAALRCRSHAVADAAVRARGSFGEQRWSFDVEPALGALRVEPSPRTILGFGLESAAIVVRRTAEDGSEWAPDAPLAVTLVADRGSVPATLEIPAGASFAAAELRSASVGLVAVTASADGVTSEPETLLYAWPVALVAISLALGALGGLLRAAQEELRLPPPRRSGSRLALRAAAGAFTALVLVPAAILGIAQYGLDAAAARTEAGAAVLAALAGWTGTLALTALARRLGIDPTEREAGPRGGDAPAGR